MPYRPKEPEKYRDEDWLRQKYHGERLSTSEIADICECHKDTIRRWLHRHEIEVRTQSEATKVEWEGADERREEVAEILDNSVRRCSRFMDDEGCMIASDSYDQVRMHRLTAVAEYGFDEVTEAEAVHHRLEIPWLNFPLNLQPMSKAEHRREHGFQGNQHTEA